MSLCSSYSDFQTYLALALTLAAEGYEVRLLAPKKFESIAKEWNVQFVSVSDYGLSRNCYPQQQDEDSSKENDGETNVVSTRFEIGCNDEKLDSIQLTTKIFLTEIQHYTPDLLIEGTMCEYYGLYAKYVLKILSMKIKLQEESLSINNLTLTMSSGKRFFQSYISIYDNWVQHEDTVMYDLCSKRLCDIYSKEDFISDSEKEICGGDSDQVICQSILCRILDPISDIEFVGPLIVEDLKNLGSPCNQRVSNKKQIEAFVSDCPGSKPICFCWDHTTHASYLFDPITKFITSLVAIKERGIIIGDGISISNELLETHGLASYTAKNVLLIDVRRYAYEDLFSFMKCVIHQGDSGTTDSVILSGIPSIIIPTFPEQLSNLHAICRLGVGCGVSVHFDQVTAAVFGDLIKAVVDNVKMKMLASRIGAKIRQENGSKGVIDKIKCFWDNNQDFVEAQHYKYVLKRSLRFLVSE